MTTTAQKTFEIMDKGTHDAIIDQLRACHTTEEIVEFERWFNSTVKEFRLYSVIAELLRNRSISRATASKWFEALIKHRDDKIEHLSIG
ncbi:RNA recognition motif-containing protein [Prochlorococcus marinus]|uniref:RNA recognition motif protein-like protein n=1 Tax=Prochlorococcus marinus (strain MIT 9211) TaxID=93059 RepID=A9BA39_PROM4|nr:RNA recognition motif-containing protein [Prochlorococcus marinus]ABX08701.1 RNA recognition motif protein-like protein [Prochlorococcus marinus str. MIT 9211]